MCWEVQKFGEPGDGNDVDNTPDQEEEEEEPEQEEEEEPEQEEEEEEPDQEEEEEEELQDNPNFRFKGKPKKSCKWVGKKNNRKMRLCRKKIVARNCPVTCGDIEVR